jgi:hypothetical protein
MSVLKCSTWNTTGLIKLAPVTLGVISSLITYGIQIEEHSAKLIDDCRLKSFEYYTLREMGYPAVKFAASSLGHGIGLSYTESEGPNREKYGVIWCNEVSCHNMCAVLLGRGCAVSRGLESWPYQEKYWLSEILKKHRFWVDNLPSA